ncbi:MAG: type II toxin-antitoxin system HicA family toxin [Planctomycetaceae bacterium]
MKRRKLLQHLGQHGCVIRREGARHTIIRNTVNGRQSEVPRHPEIDFGLVRKICKQLGVPAPSER